MMRMARVVAIFFAFNFACAALARAQTGGAPAYRSYAEINAGATLGHKSDASVGGEAGFQVMPITLPGLDVFVEFGHIGNAASADLDARATTIANNVGATASAVSKVNYFDAGARYRFAATPKIHPYVALGLGFAQVSNETTLSVNGTAVPPENLGVLFGSDLNGSEKAGFFMLGGGATVPFASRYFVDVSYRYGRVFQKTDDSGNVVIAGINTNRVQAGLGIKF